MTTATATEPVTVNREELAKSLVDEQARLQRALKDAADAHCGGDIFAAMTHPKCSAVFKSLAMVTAKLEKSNVSGSRKKKLRAFGDDFAREIVAGLANLPFVVNGVTYQSVSAWVEAVRDNRYGALKDAGITHDLSFRVNTGGRGRGRGAANGEGMCRLVHKDASGKRIDSKHPEKGLCLSNQATPSLSALCEKYPAVAPELQARFGSDENTSAVDKRRKVFADNGHNKDAIVFNLPDGTVLTQQS